MWNRKQKMDMVISSEVLECLAAEQLCPEMACFHEVWFSKDSFVKYLYVGGNGIFALFPCRGELMESAEEQERCRKALADMKEAIGLALYIYPIFAGEERSYYASDPHFPLELADIEQFLCGMYYYTSYNRTRPELLAKEAETIMGELCVPEKEKNSVTVLDENTLERILQVVLPLEGNECPQEAIRWDEDGTAYILRESDVMIGKINTGLVGKKEWYRVSELSPLVVLYSAVVGGCLGLHKLLTHEYISLALYAMTGGFGGILPAIDAFSICAGAYSYKEVNYIQEQNGTITRRQEKVYLRRAEGMVRGIICVAAALCIGQLYVRLVYSGLLELLIAFVTELGVSAGTVAYEHGIFIP